MESEEGGDLVGMRSSGAGPEAYTHRTPRFEVCDGVAARGRWHVLSVLQSGLAVAPVSGQK